VVPRTLLTVAEKNSGVIARIHDSDPFARWLEQTIESTGNHGDRISLTDFHKKYNAQLRTGSKQLGINKFSGRLRGHHITTRDSLGIDRGESSFQPIALTSAKYVDLYGVTRQN
jgi:hypothetical protein